jgi:L-lysine exporter family protein LysE/ArgO
MLHAFLYGVVLSFGLIIPLGVQNVFIFNQGATQKHFLHAMPSVITASVCDILLIVSAVLGVSVAVMTIPWLKTIIFVIGIFFLLYMGFVTWKSHATLNKNKKPLSAKRQVAFAASVSLFNPHAIIDAIGVLGTNALHFIGSQRVMYTFACILVSCGWFFSLSLAGHFLHKLDKTGLWIRSVNKLSALIIWGVAIYISWQLYAA